MRNGDHKVIAETWGNVADKWDYTLNSFVDGHYNPIPYIIHVGGLSTTAINPVSSDRHEVFTTITDDWNHLPDKTIWNCQFALDNGFDFIFQAFRDTYISIPRLVEEFKHGAVQSQQVVGNVYFHNVWEGYPCGGSGYWMSADFMRKLVYAGTGGAKSEDIMVGGVMRKYGVVGYHDSRYDHCSMRGGVSLHNSNITNHLWTNYNSYFQRVLGIHNWNSDWLRQEQRKELTGQWTEQDEAYMSRIPAIKKSLNFTEGI